MMGQLLSRGKYQINPYIAAVVSSPCLDLYQFLCRAWEATGPTVYFAHAVQGIIWKGTTFTYMHTIALGGFCVVTQLHTFPSCVAMYVVFIRSLYQSLFQIKTIARLCIGLPVLNPAGHTNFALSISFFAKKLYINFNWWIHYVAPHQT